MSSKFLQTNKGFTILIAVVTASILLLISITIADVALKEQVLSSASKDSQLAFYAADTGMECGLYWDQKQGVFSSTTPSAAFNCNASQVTVVDPTTGSPLTPNQIPGNNQQTTFRINNLSTDGQVCALVTVTKTVQTSGQIKTRIDSRGYNTCQASLTRLERGIEANY